MTNHDRDRPVSKERCPTCGASLPSSSPLASASGREASAASAACAEEHRLQSDCSSKITPAMLAAGVDAYLTYDTDDPIEVRVSAIFLAMECA